jgi:hypothetical protein
LIDNFIGLRPGARFLTASRAGPTQLPTQAKTRLCFIAKGSA